MHVMSDDNSILSPDFEKAFDRVGVHAVLSQLEFWKIGLKAFQLVKAFMAHRKFRVRVNDGIPQCSPLSAVIFIIMQTSSYFQKKGKCNFPQLVFENSIIKSVSNSKILGVWFDNNVTLKHQCIYLRKKSF